jgi:hypothetical protein
LTFVCDGKKYFVFSIKNNSLNDKKYTVNTYFSYKTNDGIWVASLLFYESNYQSDKPVKGKLWSKVILENTILIFNDLKLIEEIKLSDL